MTFSLLIISPSFSNMGEEMKKSEIMVMEMQKEFNWKVKYATFFERVYIDKKYHNDMLVGIADGNLVMYKKQIKPLNPVIAELPLTIKKTLSTRTVVRRIEKLTLNLDKNEVILIGPYIGEYGLLKRDLMIARDVEHPFVEKRGFFSKIVRKIDQNAHIIMDPIANNKGKIATLLGGIIAVAVTVDLDENTLAAQALNDGMSQSEDMALDQAKGTLANASKDMDLWEKAEFLMELV